MFSIWTFSNLMPSSQHNFFLLFMMFAMLGQQTWCHKCVLLFWNGQVDTAQTPPDHHKLLRDKKKRVEAVDLVGSQGVTGHKGEYTPRLGLAGKISALRSLPASVACRERMPDILVRKECRRELSKNKFVASKNAEWIGTMRIR